jgi:hypothetical protein
MATGELVEQAADQIEDVAVKVEEVADATRRLTGREFGFFFAGVGVGVAAGFAAGYYIAEHRLKTKYSKLANDEISKIREHYYQKTVAAQPKPPVDQVVAERTPHAFTEEEQEAIDEVNRLHPADEETVEEAVEVEEASQVNVFTEFDTGEDVWNYAVEVRQRKKDVPFIIHVDEFRENEPGHDQVTYTYYEADDVMANSRNLTMDDMDASIGLGNLGRWGHGSGDINIVYIRNLELGIDFEIIRDRGSFADTMPGSIRHSADDRRRRRPNRGFDDD